MENKYGLIASDKFWALSEDEINERWKGCGPGKFGDLLVPDTFWGLSMRLPCQIHDSDYEFGRTWEDKVIADEHFKYNCYVLIDAKTAKWNFILNRLRKNRADTYFEAVKICGVGAFWAKKLEQRRA